MIMAALIFIRKVTLTTTISPVTPEYVEEGRVHILQDKDIPDYVTIYRIHGPFLFGAADKIDELIRMIPELPPVLVLRLRNMTAIDATGIHALEHLADRVKASGRGLILCGAPEQPERLLERAEFKDHVGRENICDNVAEALQRARTIHEAMQAQRPAKSSRQKLRLQLLIKLRTPKFRSPQCASSGESFIILLAVAEHQRQPLLFLCLSRP